MVVFASQHTAIVLLGIAALPLSQRSGNCDCLLQMLADVTIMSARSLLVKLCRPSPAIQLCSCFNFIFARNRSLCTRSAVSVACHSVLYCTSSFSVVFRQPLHLQVLRAPYAALKMICGFCKCCCHQTITLCELKSLLLQNRKAAMELVSAGPSSDL